MNRRPGFCPNQCLCRAKPAERHETVLDPKEAKTRLSGKSLVQKPEGIVPVSLERTWCTFQRLWFLAVREGFGAANRDHYRVGWQVGPSLCPQHSSQTNQDQKSARLLQRSSSHLCLMTQMTTPTHQFAQTFGIPLNCRRLGLLRPT